MNEKKRGSGSKERVGRKPDPNKKRAEFKMRVHADWLATVKTVYGRDLAKTIIRLLDEDMKNKTLII